MDSFSRTLAPFYAAEFDFQEAALSMSVSNAVGPPRFFLLWDNKGQVLYEAGEEWLLL